MLDYSGKVSLALNDYDARLMKVKDNGQKYSKFSFNIQLGMDTKSKLICGVNAVKNTTDHYQNPTLMNQILVNLQTNPLPKKLARIQSIQHYQICNISKNYA